MNNKYVLILCLIVILVVIGACFAIFQTNNSDLNNITMNLTNDDKPLNDSSVTFSSNVETTESDESNVIIEFNERFETQGSEGPVPQQTGFKDIGNGDIVGIDYVEGFCEQLGENYPFSVQGYTAENGPGLLHHIITKVVFYYEENGQTFTETINGEGLINLEPPKKPIKAVVYYKNK